MNKHLFFLLTSCAIVAFVSTSNAASVNVGQTAEDAVVGTMEEWQKTIGEQYRNLTPEQLQQLANQSYTFDDEGNLIEMGKDAVSKEFQEQLSQIGNAISDSSSNIMGKAQEAIGLGASVSDLQKTISSLGSSLDNLESLSSRVDASLGGMKDDALNSLLGEEGLKNVENFTSQMGEQLTGAMELMNDPQALLTMGLGYIGWDQITNMSMGAAMDAVTDFLSAPSVGIPVMEGGFIASNAADKAAKAETAAVNNKVSDEKQKQLDAVGSRPSTPVGAEATQAADTDTNPALDTCPALMASYPRQTNKAYDFIKINYLDAVPTTVHAAPQKTMAGAVAYIENLFFEKKDKLTSEKRNELQKKRERYLADMVADVLTLNIGAQQNLVEDAMSIPTAPTSGCNLIDDLNVSTMIMISTAKQAMADIALQIQLLEFDGIQRIVGSEIELLDKPEEKKDETRGNEK